ncbi:unnamed protein product [Leuciscus chuanchicus]
MAIYKPMDIVPQSPTKIFYMNFRMKFSLNCQLTRLLCISISVDAEQAQAAREMAAELIRIADLLEQRVLYQAAETLTKKLDTCDPQLWSRHLSDGVQGLLHQVAGAKEFKKELVEMALTFVLMKTVCERVPRFLSKLYGTVVQYFGSR